MYLSKECKVLLLLVVEYLFGLTQEVQKTRNCKERNKRDWFQIYRNEKEAVFTADWQQLSKCAISSAKTKYGLAGFNSHYINTSLISQSN